MEQIDNLSKYGQSFQTKVLASLLSDSNFLSSLVDILDAKFFESDTNKWILSEIVDYFNKYGSSPTMDVFKVEISKIEDTVLKSTIVDQLRNVYIQIGQVDLDYVKSEFTSFCKNQNLKEVILKSVDLLKVGNYDQIKVLVDSAINVGTQIDMGHDYISEFDLRSTELKRATVPTKWDVVNDLMDGGLGPGELGVVVAPSGAGKSWILSHIGAEAVKRGLNVVHYSMELSEYYVGNRYDAVLTNIPTTDIKDRRDEVKSIISKLTGKLLIKYFPPKGVTSKKLQKHIEKMMAMGNRPDLIIIDYADLLLSHSSKSESTYQEQGGVYIELRGMSGELGIPIWTASQANRESIDSEIIEADKIADSYAKVMNADFIMSWSRRSKDKINNTARAHIMKNRFGPDGLTFPCKMDTNTGTIEVYDGNSPEGIITTKESANGKLLEKKLLHKKYVESM